MAEFMHRYLPQAKIWIPKPTWSNHHKSAPVTRISCLTVHRIVHLRSLSAE